MNTIRYPIRTVARLTGIPTDTLRAWERRYRAVEPGRRGRGRVYSEQDVRRLGLLREAIECGHSIGQIADLPDDELHELVRRSRARTPNMEPVPGRTDGASGPWIPILESVVSYDGGSADQQLGRLAALLPPRDLVYQVVLPLMRAVGEGWHSGLCTIAQEHMLSAIVRNVMGSLLHMHASHHRDADLLLATPAGELHEFGILAAAIISLSRGLGVAYLGPNLPAAEILAAAERSRVRAVILGIAGREPASSLIQDVRLLSGRLPAGTELWIGGAGAPAILRHVRAERVSRIDDFEAFERRIAAMGGPN